MYIARIPTKVIAFKLGFTQVTVTLFALDALVAVFIELSLLLKKKGARKFNIRENCRF